MNILEIKKTLISILKIIFLQKIYQYCISHQIQDFFLGAIRKVANYQN